MAKRYTNDVILAFGDTHFPYEHKHTLEFLADIKSKYQPDRVVHMGDILDIYSVSAYPTDIDHEDSWPSELRKARKQLEKLFKMFPNVDVLESNHDDRAYKKSRVAKIPREFLVPFRDIIGAPDGWNWHDTLYLTVDSTRDKLAFRHTMTGGALAGAKDLQRTVVIGHHHSKFGAQAFSPKRGKRFWGVDAGCLISDKGSPFKYNKGDRSRPIQGCVVIIEGQPYPIGL